MQFLSLDKSDIKKAIDKKSVNITVVGLGKMGLPLVTVFTNAGYYVKGLDISEKLVEALNKGETTIDEPNVEERLKSAISNNQFYATVDTEEAVKDASFIIVIIPVLTNDDGHANITGLLKTYKNINNYAPKGVIYIQESTLPPGTTSGVLKETLEIDGKVSGIDFGLVFAPERTFSGRALKDIEENYPKIIGGDTDNAANAAEILYSTVCKKGVIRLSNATTAEAVKTFKGAYRDANIAIANELAILADIYGIDILEVIRAANTEPYSNIHTPGIGVGGHCIPVYPRFLIASAQDNDYDAVILRESRWLNDYMVDYAISKIENYLKDWDDYILVMGLAYRGGVKEHRLSPTLRLVPKLRLKNAKVKVTDPLYNEDEIDAIFGDNTAIRWSEDILSGFKTIIIVTDHKEFRDIEEFLNSQLIYDGRYILKPELAKDAIIIQPGRTYLIDQ